MEKDEEMDVVPLMERRKGEGKIMGVAIEMKYGKDLGIEINIDDTVEYYNEILKDTARQNQNLLKTLNQLFDPDFLDFINSKIVAKATLHLCEIDNLINEILIERQPINYEEEREIAIQAYNEYIGAPFEEIIGKELFLDDLREISEM